MKCDKTRGFVKQIYWRDLEGFKLIGENIWFLSLFCLSKFEILLIFSDVENSIFFNYTREKKFPIFIGHRLVYF